MLSLPSLISIPESSRHTYLHSQNPSTSISAFPVPPRPPDTSPFSLPQFSLLQFLPTQHSRSHQSLPIRLFRKINPPRPSFHLALYSLLLCTAPRSLSLPPLTSAPFNPLPTLFHSFRTQQRTTRPPTFCQRPTHISLAFPFISELINQFSSLLFFPFAYKHNLKPRAENYSAFTTPVSRYVLVHFGTQFTHTLLPLLTRGASYLWTAICVWPPPATTTTSYFRLSTLRALTGSPHICTSPRSFFFSRLQRFIQLRISSISL